MERESLFIRMQDSLKDALDLDTVESSLATLIASSENEGRRLGFVIGKITPLEGETLAENKAKLAKNTHEIADLVENEGVIVFSAAAIPDGIEGKFPIDDFYRVFDAVVRNHIEILYTTEGWEQSKGALGEIAIAQNKGIEIYNYASGEISKLQC